MIFDWQLWPAYIEADARRQPSMDVGNLVDSIDNTMKAIGDALLPVISLTAKRLRWVLEGRPA